jgi:DNA-binding MarR family transcriptional regulator
MAGPHSKIDALTDLILEIFRTNGRLVAVGDTLVGSIGLTSARWQVLGAINLSQEPKTVAQLARSMGLARQSVQRLVNELTSNGLVQLEENPDHKRAKRVTFSESGEAIFAKTMKLQRPWAAALVRRLDLESIDQAAALLRALQSQLVSGSAKGEGL